MQEVEEEEEDGDDDDADDHWSGLLNRIQDFRTRQRSSGGIDDAAARRREEHLMSLIGVALDLAETESGMP